MIKVITDGLSTTEIGDLLETLAETLLKNQNYTVVKKLRQTGLEIDLDCKHNVSGKTLYVECKAYGDTISSNIIKNIIGSKTITKHDEAWLISTSDLGKEAKGLLKELDSSCYSFYSPDDFIDSLTKARVITSSHEALSISKERLGIELGEFSLIICKAGYFWCFKYMSGGVCRGYIFVDAEKLNPVTDKKLLEYFEKSKKLPDTMFGCLAIQKIEDEKKGGLLCPDEYKLSIEYKTTINDVGLRLFHQSKEILSMDDIFVYPNLELLQSDDRARISSSELGELKTEYQKCIIFGDDLSGKTSLAHRLQQEINGTGKIVLYINAQEIKKSGSKQFHDLLRKKFSEQYSNNENDVECFNSIVENERNKIHIIIDDLDALSIKIKQKKADLYNTIVHNFDNVFIFMNSSAEIEVMADSNFSVSFNEYTLMKLKQFGQRLTDDLIEKWLLIGEGESLLSDADLHNQKYEIFKKVNVVIGSNFVPTYPYYLLAILQLAEAISNTDYQGSSYAELYRSLITQALRSVNTKPEDLDFFLTYLSHVAYHNFVTGRRLIPCRETNELFRSYCEQMDISKSFDDVHSKLTESKIIRCENDAYKFDHNYSYYYFVSRYLSDNIGNKVIQKQINRIMENLHISEYANVTLFLIHHSKGMATKIIDKVVLDSRNIFKDTEAYNLIPEEFTKIHELIQTELDFFIEDKKPSHERKVQLENNDETNERKQEKIKEEVEKNSLDLFGNINLSFKTLEILGQILQSYYGSLDAKIKAQILNEMLELGFRSLRALLDDYVKFVDTLKLDIETKLAKKADITEKDRRYIADRIISNFTEVLVIIFVKRIADSISSKDLLQAIGKATDNKNTPGSHLVYLASRLNLFNGAKLDEIINLDKTLSKNHLAQRILRFLVVDHLYKFEVDYKLKQSLCSQLNISPVTKKKELGSGK